MYGNKNAARAAAFMFEQAYTRRYACMHTLYVQSDVEISTTDEKNIWEKRLPLQGFISLKRFNIIIIIRDKLFLNILNFKCTIKKSSRTMSVITFNLTS